MPNVYQFSLFEIQVIQLLYKILMQNNFSKSIDLRTHSFLSSCILYLNMSIDFKHLRDPIWYKLPSKCLPNFHQHKKLISPKIHHIKPLITISFDSRNPIYPLRKIPPHLAQLIFNQPRVKIQNHEGKKTFYSTSKSKFFTTPSTHQKKNI